MKQKTLGYEKMVKDCCKRSRERDQAKVNVERKEMGI